MDNQAKDGNTRNCLTGKPKGFISNKFASAHLQQFLPAGCARRFKVIELKEVMHLNPNISNNSRPYLELEVLFIVRFFLVENHDGKLGTKL